MDGNSFPDEQDELCRVLARGLRWCHRIFGWMRSDESDYLSSTARPYMYGLILGWSWVQIDVGILGPLSDPGIGADRPFASGRTLNVYG